jgi:hypothetical protein
MRSPASRFTRAPVAVALATVVAIAAIHPSLAEAQSAAVDEQYDLQLDVDRSTTVTEPDAEGAAPSPASGAPAPAPAPTDVRSAAREPADPADRERPNGLTDVALPTGAASGELPMGGYPATPFVLLLLALLFGGLAIRAGLAARDRFRRRHPSSPGP